MRNKFRTLLTTLFAVALALALATGCKGKEPETGGREETEKKIIISASEVSLNVYDDYVLTYKTENLTGDAVWSSDKEDIATVKDGVITARAEGNAVITVKIGETSAVCNVSVFASVYRPTLSVGEKEINLYPAGEYKIPVGVSYKNKAAEATYMFSSDTASVATVTADGEVKAVADGEAVITVTADFKGKILTDNVSVKVRTVLSGTVMKDGVAVGGETITIEAADSAEISVQTVYNGAANDEVEVSWTTDDALITLVPSGKTVTVNAIGVGNANLTLTLTKGAKTSEIQIPITVTKKHMMLKSDLVVDLALGNNCRVVLPDVIDATKVVSVTYGNTEKQVSDAIESENSVKFDAAGLTAGAVELTFESNALILKLTDVVAATMLIDDKADLDAFGAALQAGNASRETYYVLGADIDYGSGVWAYTDAPTTAFNGTFDGRGHIVSNLIVRRGFFARVNASAIIKNLGLTGLTVDGDYEGAGICLYNYGKIENCYVKMDILLRYMKTAVAGLVRTLNGGGILSNCISSVFYRDKLLAFYAGVDRVESTHLGTCYAISELSPYMYGNPNNSEGLYRTDAEFFSAVNDLSSENGWSEYWKIENGELYFGETKVIEKGITDKTATAVYDFNRNESNDYEIDVTEIDAAITSDSDITSVCFATGMPIPFVKKGNGKIALSNATLKTRLGESEVYVKTATAKYRIVVCMASHIIHSKAELDTYFNGIKGTNSPYKDYVVLASDIDYENGTWTYADEPANTVFRGKFHGRGHTISNITLKTAFFGTLHTYGEVMDLTLSGVTTGAGYAGNKIANIINGLIINCNVE